MATPGTEGLATVRIQGLPKGTTAEDCLMVLEPLGQLASDLVHYGAYADAFYATEAEAEAVITALNGTMPWANCKQPVMVVRPRPQGAKKNSKKKRKREAEGLPPGAPPASVPRLEYAGDEAAYELPAADYDAEAFEPLGSGAFEPGCICEGRFENGWHSCTVVQNNGDGTYCVDWADGTHTPAIEEHDLRLCGSDTAAAGAAETPFEADPASATGSAAAGWTAGETPQVGIKSVLGELLAKHGGNLSENYHAELARDGKPEPVPGQPIMFRYRAYLTAHPHVIFEGEPKTSKKAAEKNVIEQILPWVQECMAGDPQWVPTTQAQWEASKLRRLKAKTGQPKGAKGPAKGARPAGGAHEAGKGDGGPRGPLGGGGKAAPAAGWSHHGGGKDGYGAGKGGFHAAGEPYGGKGGYGIPYGGGKGDWGGSKGDWGGGKGDWGGGKGDWGGGKGDWGGGKGWNGGKTSYTPVTPTFGGGAWSGAAGWQSRVC